MKPYHADDWLTIHHGDARAVMAEMAPESVTCVVTSPPYFSLRDYGLPPAVWGGEPGHDHEWEVEARITERSSSVHWQHTEGGGTRADGSFRNRHANAGAASDEQREWGTTTSGTCPCGAWLGQLGLEPTPTLYVEHMVEVFRAVRRVLRRDGTLWLNLGDAYAASGKGSPASPGRKTKQQTNAGSLTGISHRRARDGFKAKDRMMIPARVAIALQEDGWYLRDEIVWHKSNPMPSSVTDRTTPAHEMVYLLSKSARYHYDAAAIAEPAVARNGHDATGQGYAAPGQTAQRGNRQRYRAARPSRDKQTATAAAAAEGPSATRTCAGFNGRWAEVMATAGAPLTRNKRSVWTIPTEPYPEAHFATFPQALVEPMIRAGTPERGSCPECGAPWARIVETEGGEPARKSYHGQGAVPRHRSGADRPGGYYPTTTTVGWRPTCDHGLEPAPAVVLDPFGGSGTVALVAQRLGRKAVLIELGEDYIAQAIRRIAAGRSSGDGPAVDMPIPFADDGIWAGRDT